MVFKYAIRFCHLRVQNERHGHFSLDTRKIPYATMSRPVRQGCFEAWEAMGKLELVIEFSDNDSASWLRIIFGFMSNLKELSINANKIEKNPGMYSTIRHLYSRSLETLYLRFMAFSERDLVRTLPQ
jgi:hypothetical protein